MVSSLAEIKQLKLLNKNCLLSAIGPIGFMFVKLTKLSLF